MEPKQEVHLVIAEKLEEEIRAGIISGMEWSQKELAERCGVAGNTIRRALDHLQKKGFVTEFCYGHWIISASRKGWDMDYDPNLSPSEKLSNFLERTFCEEKVELSVWSVTTESLYDAIIPIITDIRMQKRPRPKSITVRLMLPNFNLTHGMPFLVHDPTDPRPQERLRGICQSFAIPLVKQIESLEKPGELRVKVLIKTTPQMPQQRIYLNDEESMSAPYVYREHEVAYNGEKMYICDLLSADLPLIYHSARTEQAEQNRRAFDSHWNVVAKETAVLDI
jgi:DNA-binding transcriptional regulator YhcF (GntR family)